MGTNDISAVKAAGDVIDETWYNDMRSALKGVFVPRDASTGAVAGGSDLGSALYPWGNLYAAGLVIGGTAVDLSTLTGSANSIVSGKVRSTSAFPDFIRANGAAASFQILGATTNLVLNINSIATTVTTDITKSSLTVAPSSNNTCLVNDVNLAGGLSTKNQGEDNTVLTIDTAGTEVTNRIGQYCIFKTGAEYMLAYIESATQLTNIYRGFLFDSAGAPLPRIVISNNDTLTIMSTGWVFVENDGATVDVSYTSPKYAYTAPGSPVTGDYWYDRANETWKRYSGSAFVTINRTLVGVVAIDATNCVASRSFNFDKTFNSFNPISIKYESATVITALNYDFEINVYGTHVKNEVTKYKWDITTDLEAGQTEAASTVYYAYITDEGKPTLSNIKPYDQRGQLAGFYHPFNAWRCVGYITNNGSSNFDVATIINYSDAISTNIDALSKLTGVADYMPYFTGERTMALTQLTSFARTLLDDANQGAAQTTLGITVSNQQTFTGSGTWTKPSTGTYAFVRLWGAGGGGGGNGGGAACSGGGGGSYKESIFLLSALGSTETVTIGAGGAGSSTTNGTNGGSSSFGSWITAYGGSGGGAAGQGGGAAGGYKATATAGTQFNDISDGTVKTEGTGGTITPTKGIGGYYTGGGGGGSSGSAGSAGGYSVWGGGGGAGGQAGHAAGLSVFGGNGGDSGSVGTQPAGGGGGSETGTGGAGAAGKIIIYTW